MRQEWAAKIVQGCADVHIITSWSKTQNQLPHRSHSVVQAIHVPDEISGNKTNYYIYTALWS